MKNLFKIALIASLFIVGLPTAEAQKALKEGRVEYEITDVQAESADALMMKGTLINVYFNEKNTKMNLQMMGGMVTMDILTETATKKNTLLMNMMGRKVQVNQPDTEETADTETKNDFDITYDKSDKKEIAGRKCIKATLIDKINNDTIRMYVAKKVMPKVKMLDEMFPGLEGLPMEINIMAQGMGMTITAQKLKESVDEKVFSIPEGYEKMTPEQFQKEMGGLGNLGF